MDNDKAPEKPEKGPAMDRKFRRVLVAAGRAEQLMRGARPKLELGKSKPTRLALAEVDHRMIEWDYGPPPPKPVAEEAQASEEPQGQPAEVH